MTVILESLLMPPVLGNGHEMNYAWNLLPFYIKSSPSLDIVKKRLKSIFLRKLFIELAISSDVTHGYEII